MKKIAYLSVTATEMLLLAGAYAVQYFTQRKMGMARFVICKNQAWERDYPMELLQCAVPAALTVLMILLLLMWRKKHKSAGRLLNAMPLVTIALMGLYVAYMWVASAETMRAYYFISLLLGAAAFLQLMKTGGALLLCGERRDEA